MKLSFEAGIWYFIFFAGLLLFAYFEGPRYLSYLKGENWLQIEVKQNKKVLPANRKLVGNVGENTKVFIEPKEVVTVNPTKGSGVYFLAKHLVILVLEFVSFWFLIKLLISLQTHNKFEKETAIWLRKLGWGLLLIGSVTLFHKYLLKFYLLNKVGLIGYEYEEIGGGGYLLVGVLLIYFYKFQVRGYSLQKENELTV